MKYGIITIVGCLLFLMVISANGHRHTKFSIRTEMTTFTRTVLTTTVCVILAVDPMPVCRRRRRQLWMEQEPELFWIPEEQFFIQPTHMLQVEPTELPSPWFRDDDDQQDFPFDANVRLFNMAHHDIQPSLLTSLSQHQRKIPFNSSNNGIKNPLTQTANSDTRKVELQQSPLPNRRPRSKCRPKPTA
ncbi:hypothetical protein DAPPUDRAFT_241199 [Daphnia pulex]|uniref:Uncharacterized protein n=1 Tax=Daphnia pulex TaxID=6669 RepID=E9GDN6_DAPPU|nr:hypothetical protein DAPPUDRAFT_241199 [Daphnia pulex]|eukprot:EFX82113.1 hypothetical protein DAPPUDRAFT_241199 [Daphnia pulex]